MRGVRSGSGLAGGSVTTKLGVVLGVAALGVGGTAMVADAAFFGRIPLLRQLTHATTGTVGAPKLRLEKGSSVAFISNADVLGPGTETPNQELYLIDTSDGSIQRLTNTDGDSYDAVRETDATASLFPDYVAFVSTGDLVPSVGNPEHNPEIFIVETASGEIHQITNTGAGIVNAEPHSSDGGQCLVFRSNADLDTNLNTDPLNPDPGYSNPDGSDEIFLIRFEPDEFTQRNLTQISNGPAGTTSSKPVIGGYWFTRQCRTTAYESNHDQLGNGSTGQHIYEFTKTAARTDQISKPGPGNSMNPVISGASNFARGPFVVFDSDANPLEVAATGREVYRNRIYNFELIQYTHQVTGESQRPVVADGGGMLAYESTAELLNPDRRILGGGVPPFNADGNSEIFRSKDSRLIWQLTETENCESHFPSMDNAGFAIAFVSTCDLIPGQNPNGLPQVFLYRDTKKKDPEQFSCPTDDDCCNIEKGCFQERIGLQMQPKPSRRDKPWY